MARRRIGTGLVATAAIAVVIMATGLFLVARPEREDSHAPGQQSQSATSTTPTDAGNATAPPAPTGIVCTLTLAGDPTARAKYLADLQADYAAVVGSGGHALNLDRTCIDRGTGQVASMDTITWTPSDGDPATPTTGGGG
jgi:hypothetical protein